MTSSCAASSSPRIYLPDLSPESVSAVLRGLESQMRGVSHDYERYRGGVEARLRHAPDVISGFEARLRDAEGEEERAASAIEVMRDTTEKALAADADFSEWVAEHRAVMERRSILKTRRTRLVSTANIEKFRYEENKPFAYLLMREFGEQEYEAGFFARRLDGWLARRIDFETLRRNYRVIKTGPHAIQAEMRRLTTRAEELEGLIDAREEVGDQEFGLIALLQVGARAQRSVVEARQALEEATERRDALTTEMRALDADRGSPYERALRIHAEYLLVRMSECRIPLVLTTERYTAWWIQHRFRRTRKEFAADR